MKNDSCRAMGAALAASMAATTMLLLFQGRWTEAIPLHLCSVSAVLALLVSLGVRGFALDFLWYLGLPGAVLALAFPAPAQSVWQGLFNLAYTVTHAVIVLLPVTLLRRGIFPRTGQTARMIGALLMLSAVCAPVNAWLDTNFLFLSAPPAGTPLEAVYRLGSPAYLSLLGVMMASLCAAQSGLLRIIRAMTIRRG